jgi:pimeloyl-ACP methyl ester carboxylesterase
VKQLSLHGTALEISGSGPSVVLLHGVGLNQSIWAEQVRALATDFQVITYDLFGHGRSSLASANASLADWVDQLDSVVSDLEVQEFALVGFSFGGLIAQSYAAKHAHRIEKLVLMSTVYDRSEAQKASVLSRLEIVKREGPHATIPTALSRWFSPQFAESHPDVMDRYVEMLRENDATSFLSAYTCFATVDGDLVGVLANFTRPALIMTGELDTGSTPDMARNLAGMIPGAECSIIAGGRHMMPVEMPDEVNAVLRRFLKKESL